MLDFPIEPPEAISYDIFLLSLILAMPCQPPCLVTVLRWSSVNAAGDYIDARSCPYKPLSRPSKRVSLYGYKLKIEKPAQTLPPFKYRAVISNLLRRLYMGSIYFASPSFY